MAIAAAQALAAALPGGAGHIPPGLEDRTIAAAMLREGLLGTAPA